MDSVIRLHSVHSSDSSTCGDKKALCLYDDGKFTCAPKSIQMMGRWDEFDADHDGTWTVEEASSDKLRSKFQCRFGLDPLVFYEFLIDSLTSYEVLKKNGLI